MSVRTRFFLTGALLSVMLGAASASAEPQRGRTTDGRAYRIEKGMRLTDYIAELEVANDDLRRQLNAAEDELIDLQKAGQSGAKAPVKEKDLISGAPTKAAPLPPARQESDSCQLELSNTRSQLESANARLREVRPPVACNYESPENPYLKQVRELERLSASGEAATRAQLIEEQGKRADLERELESVRSDASTQREKVAGLEAQLGESKRTLASARESARESTREDSLSRAALAQPVKASAEEKVAEVAPAAVPSAHDEQSLTQLRTELNTSLQSIQSLIIERKNLLDSIKSRGKGVSINLQPLTARSGKSLDTLRAEVKALSSTSGAGELRTGIAEIAKILNDDIGVLKRLSR